jgi:NitT/TauT family transport system permease protein
MLVAIFAVPLGLAMGWNKKIRWLAFPLFEILRPIPVIAWIPIAVIMFQTTEFSIWWLIFLGAFFPIGLNTMHGTSSVPLEQVRAAQSLGASKKDLLFKVILPSASPAIYTGMTISMGLTWVILVAAEMVAGGFGIGYMTWEAYILVTYPRIVLGMLTIGACGWLFSAMIRKIADVAMPWRKIF